MNIERRLREAVRQRAGFRCEYCQFPEALMAEGVYRAKTKRERG